MKIKLSKLLAVLGQIATVAPTIISIAKPVIREIKGRKPDILIQAPTPTTEELGPVPEPTEGNGSVPSNGPK